MTTDQEFEYNNLLTDIAVDEPELCKVLISFTNED